MSMLTYLSGSIPLPVGVFITAPDVVYDNYTAYKQSKNFIEIESEKIRVSPPYDFVPQMHKANCPVHFYENSSMISVLSIDKYDKEVPRTRHMGKNGMTKKIKKQDIIDQDVTGQFTSEYIYYLGFIGTDEKTLRDYLCVYLKPGEKAELYKCWARTESQERDKTRDKVVDLQNFIINGDITIPGSENDKSLEKQFITYIAPLNNNIQFDYINCINREDIIRIYADTREEFILISSKYIFI